MLSQRNPVVGGKWQNAECVKGKQPVGMTSLESALSCEWYLKLHIGSVLGERNEHYERYVYLHA